jgi:anti-sigma regulatory factor (Ser/Thr protein kinase)
MPTTVDRSTPHRQYPMKVSEDVGVLRRAVATRAAQLPGLPDGDAELVATELATNILRHTSGGYVLCRPVDGGIELIAVDHGAPGRLRSASVVGAPSQGGGLGVGLAAVRRRAATFGFYRTPYGAVVLARLLPARRTTTAPIEPWQWGAVTVPRGGGGESGDAWAVTTDPSANSTFAAVIVDGLGHGPEAASAAARAIEVFERQAAAGLSPLPDFTRQAHQAMLGTRGGVLGVCLIDHDVVTYTGVGNTTGRILGGPRGQHLIGQHGTLGTHLAPPTPKHATYARSTGATLILTTDGIDTRWDPAVYPELLSQHPAVVAATLHRDHARSADDATILVARDTRTPDLAGAP